MVWLSIVGLLAGALLAQRFKVIVLLPATLVVAVVAIAAGAQLQSASVTILTIVVASVTLQVGYVAGALLEIRGSSVLPDEAATVVSGRISVKSLELSVYTRQYAAASRPER